jgi:putative Mn2+ efflux pump MntP
MHWLETLGLALGLAMDALAVSVAVGLQLGTLTGRHVFRLAFHFGLFQFLMPVLGWLAGMTVASYISGYDHWVAFALLAFVGGRMLWEARPGAKEAAAPGDPTRGWMLMTLSVATSLDALAVGLSLAFLRISVWVPSVVIGVVCAALTALGIGFGSRIGRRFGRWPAAVGGLVLLGIGIKILAGHGVGS